MAVRRTAIALETSIHEGTFLFHGGGRSSPRSHWSVLADHFEHLERVHEERFERARGPLRPAARRAASRFLDCGLLEHGFARVRCEACRAEFLVAFCCKGRQFRPSCRARRLGEWSLWLLRRLRHQAAVVVGQSGAR